MWRYVPGVCVNVTHDPAASPGDSGRLQWTGSWVVLLDTMLQMVVAGLPGRSLRLPTRIRSVCVDPGLHLQRVSPYGQDQQGGFNPRDPRGPVARAEP